MKRRVSLPAPKPGADRFGPMTPLIAAIRAERGERINCTMEEWPAIRAALLQFAAASRRLGRTKQAEFAEAEAKRLGEMYGDRVAR